MKGSKSTTGEKNHNFAMENHRLIGLQCDSAVRAGIEKVHALTTSRHSMRGPFSLTKLIREHVDEPVNAWLKKYDEPIFSYSKMLLKHGTGGTLYFDRLYEKIESEIAKNSGSEDAGLIVSIKHTDLSSTCSALIELAFFACEHQGDNESEIVIEFKAEQEKGKQSQTIVNPKKRTKRLRRRPSDLASSIDFSKMLADARYCELCMELNEQAQELLRILKEKSVASKDLEKALVNDAHIVRTPGFSNRYCAKHSPTQNPSSYNKASARRELYGSMRRFVILIRQKRNLACAPVDLIRAASFVLSNDCPNSLLVKKVPAMLREWNNLKNKADQNCSHLVSHLEEMLDAFEAANHQYAQFIRAVYEKSGLDIYQTAMACGLHTQERDDLIQSGFITDPIALLEKVRATVFLNFNDASADKA